MNLIEGLNIEYIHVYERELEAKMNLHSSIIKHLVIYMGVQQLPLEKLQQAMLHFKR